MNNNDVKISIKERIFHSLLFEIIALILIATFVILFTNQDPLVLTGFGLFMSLTAMSWNYIYNIIFDKKYGNDRMNRSIKLRVFHAFGFELGLMLVSTPVLMHLLNMNIWQVLLINLGSNTFFLIYSLVYNWSYDNIKHKIIIKNKEVLV